MKCMFCEYDTLNFFVNFVHCSIFATEPQPYRIQNHQKRQPNPRTETRARQWHFLNNKSREVVKPGGVRHSMSCRVAASPSWWRYWKRQVSRIPSARSTCYFIISCRQFPPFLSCWGMQGSRAGRHGVPYSRRAGMYSIVPTKSNMMLVLWIATISLRN